MDLGESSVASNIQEYIDLPTTEDQLRNSMFALPPSQKTKDLLRRAGSGSDTISLPHEEDKVSELSDRKSYQKQGSFSDNSLTIPKGEMIGGQNAAKKRACVVVDMEKEYMQEGDPDANNEMQGFGEFVLESIQEMEQESLEASQR